MGSPSDHAWVQHHVRATPILHHDFQSSDDGNADPVQDRLKKLRGSKGKSELGKVTVDMAIGGMRGIPVGT